MTALVDEVRNLERRLPRGLVEEVRAELGIGDRAPLDGAPPAALERYAARLRPLLPTPVRSTSAANSTITVGSSDVAAILGVSPWAGPWSAWTRLMGLTPRYDETDTRAQARGRMLEPSIGNRYAQDHELVVGRDIMPGPPIGAPPLLHPTEPWMACRPDFLVGVPERRIVEAKSTRLFDAGDGWGQGAEDIPAHYAVQVLWQLAVVCALWGVERADLAAFATLADEYRVFVVRRRPRLERAIIDRVRDWYERHVVEGHPPAIDGTEDCGHALALRHGQPSRDRWVAGDHADLALARDLARVRAQIDELKVEARALQHRLCDRIGDAHGLEVDGERLATWSARRGRRDIDGEALRRDHPEIAARYATVGEPGRTFKLLLETP